MASGREEGVQVRALGGEEEVDAWLDFVAACFAFKGVPRRHFATHFWSDPWRCARMIVVAETTPAPELLATLRIFDRRLYLKDGRIERVGGIGEVGTHAPSRCAPPGVPCHSQHPIGNLAGLHTRRLATERAVSGALGVRRGADARRGSFLVLPAHELDGRSLQ